MMDVGADRRPLADYRTTEEFHSFKETFSKSRRSHGISELRLHVSMLEQRPLQPPVSWHMKASILTSEALCSDY
jgi:hypothetical protein